MNKQKIKKQIADSRRRVVYHGEHPNDFTLPELRRYYMEDVTALCNSLEKLFSEVLATSVAVSDGTKAGEE